MYKEISGFCSVANDEKTIDINYISASFDNQTISKKSRYTRCVDCNSQTCPLFENAPKQI